MNACPGCGQITSGYSGTEDCDHCEYYSLVRGQSHYCGRDECYCSKLRAFMQPEVLEQFAQRFAAERLFQTVYEAVNAVTSASGDDGAISRAAIAAYRAHQMTDGS